MLVLFELLRPLLEARGRGRVVGRLTRPDGPPWQHGQTEARGLRPEETETFLDRGRPVRMVDLLEEAVGRGRLEAGASFDEDAPRVPVVRDRDGRRENGADGR